VRSRGHKRGRRPIAVPRYVRCTYLKADDVGVIKGLEQVDLLQDELEGLLALDPRQLDGLHGVLGSRLAVGYRLDFPESPDLLRVFSVAAKNKRDLVGGGDT